MRAIADQRETVAEFRDAEDDYRQRFREIADQRETVAEFRVGGRTYRLILPCGRGTFEVDRLARDEFRRWIWRWAPYGFGAYRDTTVLSTVRGVGHEIPPAIVAAIAQVLRHVQHGPLSGVRGNA